MAELAWALPCKKVLVDASGVMTIIDVLERVTLVANRERFEEGIARTSETGQRLLIEQPWTFASYWMRSERDQPETQQARVRIVPADGGREITLSFELDMTESEKVRTFIAVPGFPWGGEGSVWLHVERAAAQGEEWQTLARVPVELRIQEAPQARGAVVAPESETPKRARKRGGKRK